MLEREKIILIWILTTATLILMVLYSPLGSPDMYNNEKSFAENQGVFFAGKIQNSTTYSRNDYRPHLLDIKLASINIASPEIKAVVTGDVSADISVKPKMAGELPVYNESQNTSNKSNYKVANNSLDSDLKSIASYSVNTSSIIENTKSGSQSGGVGGLTAYSSNKGSNKNNGPQNSGFMTLNIDMSLFGDSTNRFAANYAVSQGGTDPGVNPLENPLGDEPIPVGDGWWLLLLMVGGYTFMLRLKSVRRKQLSANSNI